MRSKSVSSLPLPVKRALRKLGADVAAARKRRRISTQTMAERAMISRPTLTRVEQGDASVSLGIYATVLFVLGLTDRLALLADAAHDPTGLALASEQLPQRIRSGGKRRDEAGD